MPEMCQSGPAPSDTGTVGMEPEPTPEQVCPAQPVEPGDGVVSDDDQGIAVGEPNPGAPPQEDPERVDPETGDPATSDTSRTAGAVGEDGVICAFAVPVLTDTGAPEGATRGGTAVAGQLPRTGPYDRLLALTALGSGLVVVGAGAAAAGRRRTA